LPNPDDPFPIYEHQPKEIQLTPEEEKIIENDFNDKITLFYKSGNRCFIEAKQFIGYVILPSHIINIKPKVNRINFVNMIKYAMNLPQLKIPEIKLKEKINNYYHIIVLFLLEELDILFQKGLNSGYMQYDDNITTVKGKILFKEHLNSNYHRSDRIYCAFSELSPDIVENRIIKYTLDFLCHCNFSDEEIESKILSCYNKLNYISLTSIPLDVFQSIQYTPLNSHYKNILTLCELILKDSSIDGELIGDRTVKSFLIDMNQLFEKFVANLLKERLTSYEVESQKISYADTAEKRFKLIPDIIIKNQNKKSLFILDTKYKNLDKLPEKEDRNQVTSYSLFERVKDIGLLYSGIKSEPILNPIEMKEQINLYLLTFNVGDYDEKALEKMEEEKELEKMEEEFEQTCINFTKEVLTVLKHIEMAV